MEFKSKLMKNLSQQLGIRKTFISSSHPKVNGKVESLYIFIKDIDIGDVLEWDQLLLYATAAFNWFPNEHSQESPHFLYFGHNLYLPHVAALLQPKLQNLGSDEGMVCLDKLRQADMLAALNMRKSQSKQPKQKCEDVPNYKIGNLVMKKNFNRKSTWDAKYIPNFTVVHLIGSRQLEVSVPMGRTRKVNVCDAHKIMLSEHIISSLPDEQVFGQKGKYINDPSIT